MRVLNYLEFAGALERSGIETAAAQQRKALASVPDVEVVTSPWPGRTPLSTLPGFVRGRELVPYDIAHCNLYGPGSVAVARHARQHDRPLVLHAHTTREDFRGSFRGSNHLAGPLGRYLRWFYSQADLVLCPSEHTRSNLAAYPVDAPIRVMSNGVDVESLEGHEALRSEYRTRFGLSGMVAFAVGSVFERKGLTTFCRVAQRTDHAFAWFGAYDTGPHASRAVRRWTAAPPDNVTFTGWIDDKRGAFGAGDVFFFPSTEENQGLVVLEAMACGRACVLADIPVFREYFTDGEDCLLRSGVDEFAEALDRLADDPDLRAELGANARETALEHSLDRVGAELREIYGSLLDMEGASP